MAVSSPPQVKTKVNTEEDCTAQGEKRSWGKKLQNQREDKALSHHLCLPIDWIPTNTEDTI